MGREPQEEDKKRLPAGTVIDNKYTISRVLGEGGMGVVYLAEDANTGVEVVLKAVRPELAHRKDVLSRTLQEGRTLARIDHPNVVHLNAVVADASGLWLVMQYIHGESLDKTIKRYSGQNRKFSFTIAIDIFRQVLQGVAAAHREGIIHRDLKPANILVRQKDGVAKVTDFGIAKPEEQARVGQGNTKGVIGSLWYMSPEQVQGHRDLDKRVDIYALGVLLFELLTGHVPFTADSSYDLMRLHVETPIPSARKRRGDLPPWVDDVLARACAKRREDRFISCEEFLASIDAAMRSAPPPAESGQALPKPVFRDEMSHADPAAPPGRTVEEDDEPSSKRWIALVAVIILGAAAGLAIWRFVLYEPPVVKKPKATASADEAASTVPTDPAPNPTDPGSATLTAPVLPVEGLAALPGRWKSELGTEFEAVRVGESVEFRVVNPAQLAPADYAINEARFTLKPSAEPTSFFVEEKMRPQATVPFDPKSRNSCQEIWTEVDGSPLVASLVGAELRVDFAKVSVSSTNLKVQGGKVVSCSKLRATARGRGRTVLKRM